MKYLVATFHIHCNDTLRQTATDLLAALAGEAGFESFEYTTDGLNGYVQEQLIDRNLLDETLQNFPVDGVHIDYTLNQAENRNWNEQWEQQGFEPIHIGNHIVIYDARSPQCPDFAPEETTIAIEARQAFGTGTHQTTRMVISALAAASPQGRRTLDCGCGTGILSIAAAKLGASECVGYDIDEWSVENTRHNAALNEVHCLTVLLGDATVTDTLQGEFDIVMANIHRNIILADMPRLVKKITAQGTLIVSGFYEDDIPVICQRAKELGLNHADTLTDASWTCLVFRNK